jgi:hypothetical protein
MRVSIVSVATLVALTASVVAHADATPSCNDAFDQSQVKRDEGKLLDARKLLRACGAQTCSPTQQKLCGSWLTDVDARMPSVVLAAKDASGADLVDVKVLMDGTQIATKLDGRGIDVDPGPHTFVFMLADGTKTETKAVADERGKGKVVYVTIGGPPGVSAVPLPGAVPAASGTPSAAPAATAPAEVASGGGAPWRTIGVVTGSVGVAGIALGAVFGAMALSTKSSDCNNGLCKPGTSSTAYGQGTVSTIGFVAGGVLLAGGVTLFLVAPKKEKSGASVALAPVIAPSTGGVQIAGSW